MAQESPRLDVISGSMTVVAMVCVMSATARFSGLWWAALAVLLVALGVIHVTYLRRCAAAERPETGPGR